MPDWDKILTQVAAVTAAPLPFLVAVLIVAGLIWWLLNWRYSALLGHKDAEIKLLERKIANSTAEPNDDFSSDPESTAPDKQAYREILDFCLDRLLPACHAQSRLQHEMIYRLCDNKFVAELAAEALHSEDDFRTGEFWKNYRRLSSGLAESPGPIITFDAIIDCIFELEKSHYKTFCERSLEIIKSKSASIVDVQQWTEWRDSHNALIDAYEPIKRDPRFGKLLRPARPSRWGEKITANSP
ncbi:hypothetical protein FDV58_18000 [Bradyrhizobium elkanii]|uniref:DUF4760 domain-containing protein n=1 Tax=Bradyrhizobium elkanii TaxID=29448 RepID=A0A4U6RY14_BRAEL|nr:hypothetical protein [Bradyrhizobium elkanii]TKV80139.1 hypothetical protein FDV58_18000 [Bradyrhizobium elkanii]